MKDSTKLIIKYSFGLIMILLGVIFQVTGIGNRAFLGFGTVSAYLIYVGFLSLIIITLKSFTKKKRLVDERMIAVANKANRIVFISIIFAGFAIMIIDGIKPINIAYSLFMSYLICGIILVYAISYKILLKFN